MKRLLESISYFFETDHVLKILKFVKRNTNSVSEKYETDSKFLLKNENFMKRIM